MAVHSWRATASALLLLTLLWGTLPSSCASNWNTTFGAWFQGVPMQPVTASALRTLLQDSWQGYQSRFIQGDGRVIDHKAAAISTSEGQSYALLRAVWMNDAGTFDRVWQWSRNNLQVRGDALLGWKWGQTDKRLEWPRVLETGQWGLLDPTSASDADQDVALALLLAAERWNRDDYRQAAQTLLKDVWNKLVVPSRFGPLLLPGDWYKDGAVPDTVKINPSYFAPYAYRVFAQHDPAHDWKGLIRSGYQWLAVIQKASPHGYPPNWVEVNRQTGQVVRWPGQTASDEDAAQGDFGYDAFRLLWRLEADHQLFGNPSAAALIKPAVDRLARFWRQHHQLPGPWTAQNRVRERLDSEALYGGLWPSMARLHPAVAQAIAHQWALGHFDPAQRIWLPERDYYAQNWYAFGAHLRLVQLEEGNATQPRQPTPTQSLLRLAVTP